jgi:lysophospholipid acyltransferase (LPLAT)-like uncharacterized protein
VSGVVVPHEPRWFQRVAAWLLWAGLSGLLATLRYRFVDTSGLFATHQHQPFIFCVWHNRLAVCLAVYDRYVRKRTSTPGMAAMVSASKDGAFLASVLQRFKVQPVRGSSSRRGHQALIELTSWAERGYDLALTPDGPRGPRYVVQNGAISLAQVTGLGILPATMNLSFKISVRSWDRFQIPLPFAVCEVRLAKAIYVPRDASDEQREALRREMENWMKENSRD